MVNSKKCDNEDSTILFLNGLNDDYAMITSTILMMGSFPDRNRAFSLFIQHEIQNMLEKLVITRELSPISTNVVDRRKSGVGYRRGKGPYKSVVCALCGKLGQIVEVCYKKRGYPPGLRTDSINISLEECKALSAILRKSDVKNSVDKSANQATIYEFTQFKGKLCVSCNSINSNLDSGETYHICFYMDVFHFL